MYKLLISLSLYLFASAANALIIEDRRQIVFDWNEDISTIYSLNISGRLLDLSFDQAFGTPDLKSLGVEDPSEAFFTILEITNNVWIYDGSDTPPYHLTYKFPFATFSNALGGMRYYVQNGEQSAYLGTYGAGWQWSEVSTSEPLGLVYFRHAIPNAFLTTVPEPTSYSMIFFGISLMLIVSQRRKL